MAFVIISRFGTGSAQSSETKTMKHQTVTMTILYDNYPYDARLKTAWGFSCLIEIEGRTILFDTGGEGRILLHNMKALNIDPKDIDTIVLSHIHGDHTGGLEELLKEKSEWDIYIPESFTQGFDRAVKKHGATVVRVHASREICPGMILVNETGYGTEEQFLLMETDKGAILMTGCAHPGIVNIVKRAKTTTSKNIYMVLGGWHLSHVSGGEIKKVVEAFQKRGVQKVSPCHCTGDRAMEVFKSAYGDDFITAGVGKIFKIE
jgi:7,8-dihydropterin-6-yl-methyl-4-(beta-D-ribofuranosyl)aminobenzene 5'-phosphate synthase